MSAYARSVCVWLFTGLFSGLGLAMVFAPHRWWLGAIEGFAAAGFIRYAPWLVRQLIRGIVYAVRRPYECRGVIGTMGVMLFSVALWAAVILSTGIQDSKPETPIRLIYALIVACAGLCYGLGLFATACHLVYLFCQPKDQYHRGAYRTIREFAWYGNPIVIAWLLCQVLYGLLARLYRTTGQSRVLGFATGMALGSSLGYLLGQPAIGMAVGAVAVCLWSWKRQKACPA